MPTESLSHSSHKIQTEINAIEKNKKITARGKLRRSGVYSHTLKIAVHLKCATSTVSCFTVRAAAECVDNNHGTRMDCSTHSTAECRGGSERLRRTCLPWKKVACPRRVGFAAGAGGRRRRRRGGFGALPRQPRLSSHSLDSEACPHHLLIQPWPRAPPPHTLPSGRS